MAENVKVFKNDGSTVVTPADMNAAVDYTLMTTSASQRAVIKDVTFKIGGKGVGRCNPALDLNGATVASATGGSLEVSGNLIVGPSSTLKVKFTPAAGYVGTGNSFSGVFFTEGGSGAQWLTGDGASTNMNPVKATTANHAADDACAAKTGGVVYYYKLYQNNIKKYTESSIKSNTAVAQWTHGGGGQGMCTDGTYIYRSSGTNSNQIFRTKLSDLSTSTLTTTSNYSGPQGNQGSIFVYHDGKIYTRREGGNSYLDIINLTTLAVTRKNDGNFDTGSYSDGGFTTKTIAGKNYVVEAGTSHSYYYDIDLDTVTRFSSSGTSSSTEYAQGGGEVSPGVGIIFGEQGDRATTIDMNAKTWVSSSNSSHGYTTDYGYGNRFGFAAFLASASDPTMLDFNYSALVSGVEIT
jgi:hypothetical protein